MDKDIAKMKKPIFGGYVFQIIDNIISFSATIVSFATIDNDSLGLLILVLSITYFGTYIVVLLLYNVIYTIRLNKYCKFIEKENLNLLYKNNGLKNDNSKIITDYKNLYSDFERSLVLGNTIIRDLENAIVNRSESESLYLKQLLDVILIKQEVREKMKGENKHE